MIADFAGMLPLRDALLLPDNNGQYAENCWLYRGQVRGFRIAPPVYEMTYTDTQAVYRIPLNDANPPDFSSAGSQWLEYPDPFMATIRNPTVGDEWNRYYFFPSDQWNSTGDNWPVDSPGPTYTTLDNITSGGEAWYVLGVPAPINPPTVTPPITSAQFAITTASGIGGTFLYFASISGVSVGMNALDITTTEATAATNLASPQYTTTLYFSSTTGIAPGMSITSYTNPASIVAGTTVALVGPTSIIMSTVALIAINAGDIIEFKNSQPIIPGTTVVDVNPNTVELSAGTVGAGALVGDVIQFTAATPETRAYVYTYVTIYGEEGQPSPATVATGDTTDTWTIVIPPPTGAETPPIDDTLYGTIRLYRTVTDASGNATYYQVTEVPFDFTDPITITDSAPPSAVVVNIALGSIGYAPPPAGLQGVVMMANGIAAGFTNEREIWFSAAYLPHAWPPQYALTVDYPVVGLTANGSSLNIITEGSPFIATGVTPDTMTIGKITANEPCIGRGSIVSAGEGAYYASPNGVQLLNTGGTTNITSGIYEKEFHNELTPEAWASGKYGESYVTFIKGAGINTPLPPEAGNIEQGFVIDETDANVPFTYVFSDTTTINNYVDELSGQIFRLDTGSPATVTQWNPPVGVPGTTTLNVWQWATKQFRFTAPQQFKAFMVLFEVPPEVNITLGVRNTDQNQVFDPDTQYLIAYVVADDNLIVVREIQQSGEVILIPGGFKAEVWEFWFTGQVSLTFFKAASSVKELKAT
jgi:hypothetical protein